MEVLRLEFNERILEIATDTQMDLIDHLHYDKTHQGFLMSLPKDQFFDAYEKIYASKRILDTPGSETDEKNALMVEAIILLKYRDDKNEFTSIDVLNQCNMAAMNYSLVKLYHKGLLKPIIGKTDSEWSWGKVEAFEAADKAIEDLLS